MCGRTACTLDPCEIVAACQYKDCKGVRKQPQWIDAPSGHNYFPLYNKAPSSFNPVIVSSNHFNVSLPECERIIMPMKWGMTPSWFQGDPYRVPYETNNCRSEGMMEKKTFKLPLKKGYRCVVLADGFFEWQTSKEGKQPFLFYFPQPETVKFPFHILKPVKEESTEKIVLKKQLSFNDGIKKDLSHDGIKNESLDEDLNTDFLFFNENKKKYQESGIQLNQAINESNQAIKWTGPRLLTMAGVFDVWSPNKDSPALYSYSIITVSASSDLNWCHHRMPAILTNDEEINDWLDYSNIPLEKAVSHIKPQNCLRYHPVSNVVNNSRYQSIDCVTPIELGKSKTSASSNLMLNWLKSDSLAKKRKV